VNSALEEALDRATLCMMYEIFVENDTKYSILDNVEGDTLFFFGGGEGGIRTASENVKDRRTDPGRRLASRG